MKNQFFSTRVGKVTVVFFILLFVAAIAFWLDNKAMQDIKSHLKTTAALVTKVDYYGRYHNHRVDYCFKINADSNICVYNFADEIPINILSNFEHKYLVVAYDSIQPSICRILITQKDYSDFNIPYPDSLNRVKDILKE